MSMSAGSIDFEGIGNTALANARIFVPAWLPNGKAHGREYRCGGVDGAPGDSLSINLTTGLWADFATGEKGGDLISLYAAIKRLSQPEAAKAVASIIGQPIVAQSATIVPLKPREDAQRDWTAILPVPADAPAPPDTHYRHGAPAHVARYLDLDGALLGLIYRCEPADQRKEILPLTYCGSIGGQRAWRWQSLPKPRSLYGAELLRRGGRILIVEGEPKADAARRMLGDAMTVIAWPGGSKAVAHADWSMLAGRDVVIWPDADGPGLDAAAQITIQLRHHGATVRTVELPDGLDKGWDLADAETEGRSASWVMDHIDPPSVSPPLWIDDPDVAPKGDVEHVDFLPLGHDKGRFYFFTSGGGQVRDFSGRDLQSIGCLLELAPLRYWEMNYPAKNTGFSVNGAGDALLRACYKIGIYDAERLRGRGAWLDEGRVVMHLGNRIVVDGQETDLSEMRSQFIYEQGRRLSLVIGEAQLSSQRASRLMDLCMAAPWEDAASMGRMLAGWLVIAPVCGAMPWRPHIWVTGEAGSGKTHIVDNIIRPVIGDIALPVASKTSEAGVRGDLGLDARPVVFDEFESQNEHDRARVQQVLDLARQASSEDGAAIVKGTKDGGSRRYRIRSCFCFSSINLGLQQQADETRTVVLTVTQVPDPVERRKAYARLVALEAEVLTPDFQSALLARTLELLPVIRTNAEVFASAIARTGVSRRTGDTIGVLLAGAWSLRSRKVATAAEADAFLEGSTWLRNAVGRSETDPEWRRAIDFLVQVPLRTSIANRNAHQDISVGELIGIILGTAADPITNRQDAETTLLRAGIRVEGEHLLIANSSEPLKRAFSSTSWSASWAATIARTPDCEKLKPTKFGAFTSRGLKLPLGVVA